MASHPQDGADGNGNGNGNGNARPVPSLLLTKKPQGAPRSSEEARRNRINMEKMIMKNVASRTSMKNRAQQILEALKKKRQLQQDDAGDAPAERPPKRKKTSPPRDDANARAAVVAGILSPARRSTTTTPAPGFASPSRRPNYAVNLRSPTPHVASPARARTVNSPARGRTINPLYLSSPVRPPRSATLASPARPRRSSNAASPLRRSEFLTSPLRHRPSASPKRPLMFDDSTMAGDTATTATRINGHPPLLSSALDQVELAPPPKTSKVARTAKSPFQSFQAKFNKSPAKPARVTSSPGAGSSSSARAGTGAPRSGPTLVDLAHPDESAPRHNATTAASSSAPTSPSTAASAGTIAQQSLSTASSSAAATPSTSSGADSTTRGTNIAPEHSGPGSSNPGATANGLPNTPTHPPKPVRKLFSSRVVAAQKSICFSTEGVATALDVTPDGEIIVVGFTDGSVRLYEMDSSVPSDRHGYLLGHIDEQSSQGSFNVQLRVKISPDGRYVFVGCRRNHRVMMSINLDHYRSEKDGDDDDFQQFQKHFHANSRLRGFADVTTYIPPSDPSLKEQPEIKVKRSAYYILTGLGVGTLNLWRFVEPQQPQQDPIWEWLQGFGAGGNTAMIGAFLPSSISPGVLTIAAVCKDKNLRLWPMEYKKTMAVKSEEDSASEMDDAAFLGGSHMVASHFNIQNTKDIHAIHGQYAYGISLMGEAYRICLPDSANLSASTTDRLPRQEFELEKIDSGGTGKSRRSNVMLESLAASDDGKAMVAVSSDGIFYYSNKIMESDSAEVAKLRIIGKNASENSLFKTLMKVYTPSISVKDKKTKPESMMAVVTNPKEEGEDDGYVNVDPTEGFAARWMVPSRGIDCWVCGVRNVRHWSGPPESKLKERKSAEDVRAKMKKARQRERAQRSDSNPGTPVSVKSKATPQPSAKRNSAQKQKLIQSDGAETPQLPPSGKKRRMSQNSGAGDDDDDEDEDCTGSDENTPSIASLMSELDHFKKRNAEIKTEWQRRLQGERQLRRKWKQREEEFLDQLNDSLTKLDTAEVEVGRLRVLLRDAEKRFAFERARAEQENSVKARYDQLCEQMKDKMALVADQKRLLEQTTRSLLTEVDRNVHALKNAVILDKSECVVCKDQQAVTAVVPCGHLCFCEQDADTYRRNSTSEYPTCPICQQEIVSLLRIYT